MGIEWRTRVNSLDGEKVSSDEVVHMYRKSIRGSIVVMFNWGGAGSSLVES